MFIIFGTRASELVSEPLPDVTCEHCGNARLVGCIVQRTFHIFWIPTLPLGKVTATECMHCRQILADTEVSHDAALAMERMGAVRTPVWAFSGAMIAGLLVLVGLLGSGGESTTRAMTAARPAYPSKALESSGSATVRASVVPTWDLLESPRVDDLYIVDMAGMLEIEGERYRYGILKVVAVEGTLVTFQPGTMGYLETDVATLAIDAGALRKSDYFLEDSFALEQEEIMELYRGDLLKKVVRMD